MTPQERRAKRQALAAKRAGTIVAEATAKVVASRPISRIVSGEDDRPAVHPRRAAKAAPPRPSSPPQGEAAQVKALRDGGMAWWVIGQKLGLAQVATSAADPEAKRGAGRARALYAAANRGEVPRTHAPRQGAVVKPTGPARGGTVTSRKTQLVNDGHVIPRDMPDGEVEELLKGRAIEWAIDMARLTGTDPATWGSEDGRWCKQDAKVHPEWCVVGEEDNDGNRLVRFREYMGRDDRGNLMSGPTRTVRVDAIYTVR